MEPAGNIKPQINRLQQGLRPRLADIAALIGNANNKRFHPFFSRFLQAHIGQSDISIAALHTELTKAPIRPPIGNAIGRFRGQLIYRITQKH